MRRTCQAGDCEPGVDLVRKAAPEDVPEIVEIHQKAFSNFFLTRLGPDFLRKYYRLVLEYQSGVILVAQSPSRLAGFACGFVEPSAFYRLMWRNKALFALPVLSALMRRPSLVSKVLYAVRRIQAPASEWPPQSCELSSIAVAPEAAGNGFGKSLMRAFLAQARAMGAHCVYLTTDADGNDAVNAFYRDAGFRHTKCFLQHEGRWMNEYVIQGTEATDQCDDTH